MSLDIVGSERVLALLDTLGSRSSEVAVIALNQAGRVLRSRLVGRLAAVGTGLPAGVLRLRLQARAANRADLLFRIVPSSEGIPARLYRYQQQALPGAANATRARILVAWSGGEKTAAGFINPSGARRWPLSTRLKRAVREGHPVTAAGPSLAALFKVVLAGDGEAIQAEGREILERRLLPLIATELI